ncbi:Conserved_hypothetical protein [Hexamita inflata]|uniref:Dynein heavy chain n=1 Tax=Hexamita inflata TaxID=28002 RepID=A0ABP1KGU5_9EUKA
MNQLCSYLSQYVNETDQQIVETALNDNKDFISYGQLYIVSLKADLVPELPRQFKNCLHIVIPTTLKKQKQFFCINDQVGPIEAFSQSTINSLFQLMFESEAPLYTAMDTTSKLFALNSFIEAEKAAKLLVSYFSVQNLQQFKLLLDNPSQDPIQAAKQVFGDNCLKADMENQQKFTIDKVMKQNKELKGSANIINLLLNMLSRMNQLLIQLVNQTNQETPRDSLLSSIFGAFSAEIAVNQLQQSLKEENISFIFHYLHKISKSSKLPQIQDLSALLEIADANYKHLISKSDLLKQKLSTLNEFFLSILQTDFYFCPELKTKIINQRLQIINQIVPSQNVNELFAQFHVFANKHVQIVLDQIINMGEFVGELGVMNLLTQFSLDLGRFVKQMQEQFLSSFCQLQKCELIDTKMSQTNIANDNAAEIQKYKLTIVQVLRCIALTEFQQFDKFFLQNFQMSKQITHAEQTAHNLLKVYVLSAKFKKLVPAEILCFFSFVKAVCYGQICLTTTRTKINQTRKDLQNQTKIGLDQIQKKLTQAASGWEMDFQTAMKIIKLTNLVANCQKLKNKYPFATQQVLPKSLEIYLKLKPDYVPTRHVVSIFSLIDLDFQDYFSAYQIYIYEYNSRPKAQKYRLYQEFSNQQTKIELTITKQRKFSFQNYLLFPDASPDDDRLSAFAEKLRINMYNEASTLFDIMNYKNTYDYVQIIQEFGRDLQEVQDERFKNLLFFTYDALCQRLLFNCKTTEDTFNQILQQKDNVFMDVIYSNSVRQFNVRFYPKSCLYLRKLLSTVEELLVQTQQTQKLKWSKLNSSTEKLNQAADKVLGLTQNTNHLILNFVDVWMKTNYTESVIQQINISLISLKSTKNKFKLVDLDRKLTLDKRSFSLGKFAKLNELLSGTKGLKNIFEDKQEPNNAIKRNVTLIGKSITEPMVQFGIQMGAQFDLQSDVSQTEEEYIPISYNVNQADLRTNIINKILKSQLYSFQLDESDSIGQIILNISFVEVTINYDHRSAAMINELLVLFNQGFISDENINQQLFIFSKNAANIYSCICNCVELRKEILQSLLNFQLLDFVFILPLLTLEQKLQQLSAQYGWNSTVALSYVKQLESEYKHLSQDINQAIKHYLEINKIFFQNINMPHQTIITQFFPEIINQKFSIPQLQIYLNDKMTARIHNLFIDYQKIVQMTVLIDQQLQGSACFDALKMMLCLMTSNAQERILQKYTLQELEDLFKAMQSNNNQKTHNFVVNLLEVMVTQKLFEYIIRAFQGTIKALVQHIAENDVIDIMLIKFNLEQIITFPVLDKISVDVSTVIHFIIEKIVKNKYFNIMSDPIQTATWQMSQDYVQFLQRVLGVNLLPQFIKLEQKYNKQKEQLIQGTKNICDLLAQATNKTSTSLMKKKKMTLMTNIYNWNIKNQIDDRYLNVFKIIIEDEADLLKQLLNFDVLQNITLKIEQEKVKMIFINVNEAYDSSVIHLQQAFKDVQQLISVSFQKLIRDVEQQQQDQQENFLVDFDPTSTNFDTLQRLVDQSAITDCFIKIVEQLQMINDDIDVMKEKAKVEIDSFKEIQKIMFIQQELTIFRKKILAFQHNFNQGVFQQIAQRSQDDYANYCLYQNQIVNQNPMKNLIVGITSNQLNNSTSIIYKQLQDICVVSNITLESEWKDKYANEDLIPAIEKQKQLICLKKLLQIQWQSIIQLKKSKLFINLVCLEQEFMPIQTHAAKRMQLSELIGQLQSNQLQQHLWKSIIFENGQRYTIIHQNSVELDKIVSQDLNILNSQQIMNFNNHLNAQLDYCEIITKQLENRIKRTIELESQIKFYCLFDLETIIPLKQYQTLLQEIATQQYILQKFKAVLVLLTTLYQFTWKRLVSGDYEKQVTSDNSFKSQYGVQSPKTLKINQIRVTQTKQCDFLIQQIDKFTNFIVSMQISEIVNIDVIRYMISITLSAKAVIIQYIYPLIDEEVTNEILDEISRTIKVESCKYMSNLFSVINCSDKFNQFNTIKGKILEQFKLQYKLAGIKQHVEQQFQQSLLVMKNNNYTLDISKIKNIIQNLIEDEKICKQLNEEYLVEKLQIENLFKQIKQINKNLYMLVTSYQRIYPLLQCLQVFKEDLIYMLNSDVIKPIPISQVTNNYRQFIRFADNSKNVIMNMKTSNMHYIEIPYIFCFVNNNNTKIQRIHPIIGIYSKLFHKIVNDDESEAEQIKYKQFNQTNDKYLEETKARQPQLFTPVNLIEELQFQWNRLLQNLFVENQIIDIDRTLSFELESIEKSYQGCLQKLNLYLYQVNEFHKTKFSIEQFLQIILEILNIPKYSNASQIDTIQLQQNVYYSKFLQQTLGLQIQGLIVQNDVLTGVVIDNQISQFDDQIQIIMQQSMVSLVTLYPALKSQLERLTLTKSYKFIDSLRVFTGTFIECLANNMKYSQEEFLKKIQTTNANDYIIFIQELFDNSINVYLSNINSFSFSKRINSQLSDGSREEQLILKVTSINMKQVLDSSTQQQHLNIILIHTLLVSQFLLQLNTQGINEINQIYDDLSSLVIINKQAASTYLLCKHLKQQFNEITKDKKVQMLIGKYLSTMQEFYSVQSLSDQIVHKSTQLMQEQRYAESYQIQQNLMYIRQQQAFGLLTFLDVLEETEIMFKQKCMINELNHYLTVNLPEYTFAYFNVHNQQKQVSNYSRQKQIGFRVIEEAIGFINQFNANKKQEFIPNFGILEYNKKEYDIDNVILFSSSHGEREINTLPEPLINWLKQVDICYQNIISGNQYDITIFQQIGDFISKTIFGKIEQIKYVKSWNFLKQHYLGNISIELCQCLDSQNNVNLANIIKEQIENSSNHYLAEPIAEAIIQLYQHECIQFKPSQTLSVLLQFLEQYYKLNIQNISYEKGQLIIDYIKISLNGKMLPKLQIESSIALDNSLEQNMQCQSIIFETFCSQCDLKQEDEQLRKLFSQISNYVQIKLQLQRQNKVKLQSLSEEDFQNEEQFDYIFLTTISLLCYMYTSNMILNPLLNFKQLFQSIINIYDSKIEFTDNHAAAFFLLQTNKNIITDHWSLTTVYNNINSFSINGQFCMVLRRLEILLTTWYYQTKNMYVQSKINANSLFNEVNEHSEFRIKIYSFTIFQEQDFDILINDLQGQKWSLNSIILLQCETIISEFKFMQLQQFIDIFSAQQNIKFLIVIQSTQTLSVCSEIITFQKMGERQTSQLYEYLIQKKLKALTDTQYLGKAIQLIQSYYPEPKHFQIFCSLLIIQLEAKYQETIISQLITSIITVKDFIDQYFQVFEIQKQNDREEFVYDCIKMTKDQDELNHKWLQQITQEILKTNHSNLNTLYLQCQNISKVEGKIKTAESISKYFYISDILQCPQTLTISLCSREQIQAAIKDYKNSSQIKVLELNSDNEQSNIHFIVQLSEYINQIFTESQIPGQGLHKIIILLRGTGKFEQLTNKQLWHSLRQNTINRFDLLSSLIQKQLSSDHITIFELRKLFNKSIIPVYIDKIINQQLWLQQMEPDQSKYLHNSIKQIFGEKENQVIKLLDKYNYDLFILSNQLMLLYSSEMKAIQYHKHIIESFNKDIQQQTNLNKSKVEKFQSVITSVEQNNKYHTSQIKDIIETQQVDQKVVLQITNELEQMDTRSIQIKAELQRTRNLVKESENIYLEMLDRFKKINSPALSLFRNAINPPELIKRVADCIAILFNLPLDKITNQMLQITIPFNQNQHNYADTVNQLLFIESTSVKSKCYYQIQVRTFVMHYNYLQAQMENPKYIKDFPSYYFDYCDCKKELCLQRQQQQLYKFYPSVNTEYINIAILSFRHQSSYKFRFNESGFNYHQFFTQSNEQTELKALQNGSIITYVGSIQQNLNESYVNHNPYSLFDIFQHSSIIKKKLVKKSQLWTTIFKGDVQQTELNSEQHNALTLMYYQPENSYKQVQQTFLNKFFSDLIQNFKPQFITDEQLELLEAYLQSPDFNYFTASQSSVLVTSVIDWVYLVVAMKKQWTQLEPLKSSLVQLESAANIHQQKVDHQVIKLHQIKDRLNNNSSTINAVNNIILKNNQNIQSNQLQMNNLNCIQDNKLSDLSQIQEWQNYITLREQQLSSKIILKLALLNNINPQQVMDHIIQNKIGIIYPLEQLQFTKIQNIILNQQSLIQYEAGKQIPIHFISLQEIWQLCGCNQNIINKLLCGLFSKKALVIEDQNRDFELVLIKIEMLIHKLQTNIQILPNYQKISTNNIQFTFTFGYYSSIQGYLEDNPVDSIIVIFTNEQELQHYKEEIETIIFNANDSYFIFVTQQLPKKASIFHMIQNVVSQPYKFIICLEETERYWNVLVDTISAFWDYQLCSNYYYDSKNIECEDYCARARTMFLRQQSQFIKIMDNVQIQCELAQTLINMSSNLQTKQLSLLQNFDLPKLIQLAIINKQDTFQQTIIQTTQEILYHITPQDYIDCIIEQFSNKQKQILQEIQVFNDFDSKQEFARDLFVKYKVNHFSVAQKLNKLIDYIQSINKQPIDYMDFLVFALDYVYLTKEQQSIEFQQDMGKKQGFLTDTSTFIYPQSFLKTLENYFMLHYAENAQLYDALIYFMLDMPRASRSTILSIKNEILPGKDLNYKYHSFSPLSQLEQPLSLKIQAKNLSFTEIDRQTLTHTTYDVTLNRTQVLFNQNLKNGFEQLHLIDQFNYSKIENTNPDHTHKLIKTVLYLDQNLSQNLMDELQRLLSKNAVKAHFQILQCICLFVFVSDLKFDKTSKLIKRLILDIADTQETLYTNILNLMTREMQKYLTVKVQIHENYVQIGQYYAISKYNLKDLQISLLEQFLWIIELADVPLIIPTEEIHEKWTQAITNLQKVDKIDQNTILRTFYKKKVQINEINELQEKLEQVECYNTDIQNEMKIIRQEIIGV